MLYLNAFISSFMLYGLLRVFDVWSTKLCLAELDPEMHEVNPIIAPLVKKIGFYKTMFVTWLPFATIIGLIDSLYAYPVVGIPILWLFLGLFHLLAAANNVQVYSQAKIFGAEIVEENTRQVIRILKRLSSFGKVAFLIRTNFLNVFLAFYGVAALVLLSVLLSVTDIIVKQPIPILLVVGPPIMILDLVMFFPTIVFGSLMISLRRLRMGNEQDVLSQESTNYLTFSVEFLETVLHKAQQSGANCVQVSIPYELQEKARDR